LEGDRPDKRVTLTLSERLATITMPERSYMRSSLAEMADEIRDEFSSAAVDAVG
jgi:hypothetical protein